MYYVMHVPILKERMTIPERKMHTLAFSILFASFSLSLEHALTFCHKIAKIDPLFPTQLFFLILKVLFVFIQTSVSSKPLINEFFYFLFRKLRSENQNLGCTQRGSATSDLDNAEAPYIIHISDFTVRI